jgi:TetR/AcrR family transcriptional repressor of nem operon
MASTTPRLGRPREFDEDDAARAAMQAFWRRGYHATSLTDLTEATGLHRGSLYGAFGDKHGLLIAALERYAEDALAKMDGELASGDTPLDGVLTYMRAQADQAATGRGCLIANTALELLPGDDEVAETLLAYQRAVEDRLTAALTKARLAGARSPRASARHLLAVTKGLWELGRTAQDPRPLREIVDVAMDGLT